jgi:hypothetical protein
MKRKQIEKAITICTRIVRGMTIMLAIMAQSRKLSHRPDLDSRLTRCQRNERRAAFEQDARNQHVRTLRG